MKGISAKSPNNYFINKEIAQIQLEKMRKLHPDLPFVVSVVSIGKGLVPERWKLDPDPPHRLKLLYSGEMRYTRAQTTKVVVPGNIYLFPPFKDYLLTYPPEKRPTEFYIDLFINPSPINEIIEVALESSDLLTSLFKTIEVLQSEKNYEMGSLNLLLSELMRALNKSQPLKTFGEKRIHLLLQKIHANLPQSFSLEELASMTGLNKYYLLRLFKKETKLSPIAYIQSCRLIMACEHLKAGRSIKETAEICGYKDPLYFSRVFKKEFGISPKNIL